MKHHHPRSFYVLATIATVCAFGLFISAYLWINARPEVEPTFGVTFSWVYAQRLEQDPEEVFKALVTDLGVRHVRLPVYWSDVEGSQQQYHWSLLDNLVEIAQSNDVKLTMVVGMKVPRWPECYIPDWAEKLDENSQHNVLLSFIEATVNRYKSSQAVVRWQVENEPFFPFGQCPTITVEQFRERVDLVRSLDDRPIQATVSGELGSWRDSAEVADVLGISMYRQTWNELVGHFVYPITPEYYFFRSALVRDTVAKVIVSELQAEPWFSEPIESRPLIEWYDQFSIKLFEENVAFAKQAGLSEVYLWGAEWWYALKHAGDDRLWEYARTLFN